MANLPKWSAVSYNALSLHQTRRLRHILSDLRWNSFVCIQGSERRTHEPVTQYDVGEFHVLEWGYGPAAGKASGVVIAFRRKLFSFKHLVRVYSPPSELLGRVGQLGLNEVMLISWLSMPISQSIPTRPRRSNTAIKSGRGSIMCCRKPLVDVHPYCAWMPMEELEMESFLLVSSCFGFHSATKDPRRSRWKQARCTHLQPLHRE